MIENKKSANPWRPEDEREHFPSTLEWWCAEAFFKTVEDDKQWSLKTNFTEWNEKSGVGSVYHSTIFDQSSKKIYPYYSRNEKEKLKSADNSFEIQYDDSVIKGLYPSYSIFINDKKNNIQVDAEYKAKSLPHWIAQEVTNGWLPLGLGLYRYGFIPKGDITGKMTINDKTHTIKGEGYIEHVWGDFNYYNPMAQIKEIKKTIGVYTKLIGWWAHNYKPKFPNSLIFSTENNPYGYDWAWALFDNGWTLYYGNFLFWLMKGPVAGTIILSKDGEKYEEIGNARFRYLEMKKGKKYDFKYPSEFEFTAENGKQKLFLKLKMTSDTREYIARFPSGKYWRGFVICEAPGTIEGYYFDGSKKTELKGICKIEPQRQISFLGHNSLRVDFLKPPNGVGVSLDLESHYFNKKIITQLQFAPKPKIKMELKKINVKPNRRK